MRSLNSAQLRGLPASFDDISKVCGTKLRNKDINVLSYKFNSKTIDPEGLLTPCGILPSLIPLGWTG